MSADRDVNGLIYDIVTGHGTQIENIDIADAEWAMLGRQMFGPDYEEHCEVTMRFDDWIALLALARAEYKRRHGAPKGQG